MQSVIYTRVSREEQVEGWCLDAQPAHLDTSLRRSTR
jgi:DNA invertase Pin-like site-specific DNA recombinase